MRRLVFVVMACAACGGAAAMNGATTPIVVPAQPPQPTAIGLGPAHADASASVPATKPFECKTGERFETTSRTYCAYSDPLPWDAAEHRCVEDGGHLATVDSSFAERLMRAVLGSPASIDRALWIGLEMKKTGAKKDWRWQNGAAVTSPMWSAGEPNDFYGDGSEACAEWLVSNGRWNDTRCKLSLPFLCQAAKKPLDCKGPYVAALADGKYCLGNASETYEGAKRMCSNIGGTLAGPITESEDELLRKALAARFAPTKFWIGLSDVAEEGRFAWASGALFDYSAWDAGEPNDYQKEDCVEVSADTWLWNDFDCAAPKASVCESPAKKK